MHDERCTTCCHLGPYFGGQLRVSYVTATRFDLHVPGKRGLWYPAVKIHLFMYLVLELLQNAWRHRLLRCTHGDSVPEGM